jgi:hypothetical protein
MSHGASACIDICPTCRATSQNEARQARSSLRIQEEVSPLESPNSNRGRRSGGPATVTAAERTQARSVSLRRIGRLFTNYRLQLAIVIAINRYAVLAT